MSKVQRFEDLTIFQMARDLCKDVYAITKDGEFVMDKVHSDSLCNADMISQLYGFHILIREVIQFRLL